MSKGKQRNDHSSPEEKSHPTAHPDQGSPGIDFLTAETVACGGRQTYGEDIWSKDAFDSKRKFEIANLAVWLRSTGVMLEKKLFEGLLLGGMEHNIILKGDPVERVWKVTKGGFFGVYPGWDIEQTNSWMLEPPTMFPALPSQYFRRMALAARLFPALETRFEGLAKFNGQLGAVTSQRFIAAQAATPAQLQRFFHKQGFKRIEPAAWFREIDQLALFDTEPENILQAKGKLYPIDIIPVLAEGRLLKWLESC